ncbi:cytochrome P450 family protein [Streptomyces sp. DSM 118878]
MSTQGAGTRAAATRVAVELAGLSEDFDRDPYPVYHQLRAQGPLHWVRMPDGQEFWLVVGVEEARAALTDQRLSKDLARIGASSLDMELLGPHLLVSDPPRHTRLRRLVSREFTARRVEAMREGVRQQADRLLDEMLRSDRADLVESYAFPLSIGVICELLGVPSMDRTSFRAWSNAINAPIGFQQKLTAFRELADYLADLIESKREEGGDDLLSTLIRTTDEDGDRISPDELRSMAYLLLSAGHETTVNLISNGVYALLRHPAQLAELRGDFTLLEGAVEEMLRYEGPIEMATFRFAVEPVTVGDTVIQVGDPVLVALGAANRDESRFPESERFDIRRNTQGHVAFGHGIHYCLGAPLARMEGAIAIRGLLERVPGLALDVEKDALDWLPGTLLRGVRALPVRW